MESVKAELWSVFFSVELARKRGEELGGESWDLKAKVVFETVGKMFGHSVAMGYLSMGIYSVWVKVTVWRMCERRVLL